MHTVTEPAVTGQFAKAPLAAIFYYWRSVTTPAATDPAYARAIDEFAADFQLIATGCARLEDSGGGLTLTASRLDGSRAVYYISLYKTTVAVVVRRPATRTFYRLDTAAEKIIDFEEISIPSPAVFEQLDENLQVTVNRTEAPRLFDLLNLTAGTDSVDVATIVEATEDVRRDEYDRARVSYPDAPTPFIAQVFFTAPGCRRPLRSLDIMRVLCDGKSIDCLGDSNRLRLFPMVFAPYHTGRIGSDELDDPQSDGRCGLSPDSFNQALDELVRLQRSHPTHAGLAGIVYSLPRIDRGPGVIIPPI